VVCGMQKQSKGKAARTLANLAGFESLAKMAEEPWYGAVNVEQSSLFCNVAGDVGTGDLSCILLHCALSILLCECTYLRGKSFWTISLE